MGDIYKSKDVRYGVRTSSGVMKLGKHESLNSMYHGTRLPAWKFMDCDQAIKYARESGETRGTRQGNDLYGRNRHYGVRSASGIKGVKI